MIPKIIHYCWFGRGKMPKSAIKYIKSWKKYCPNYQIKEWNEDNFDIDLFPYTKEAYSCRKYAFVTDVVRLYALYTEGGIYMDTDVEVIKPLDQFLKHTAFSGFENPDSPVTGIMASEKGGLWAKDNLEYYKGRHFKKKDGSMDLTTNVETIRNIMIKKGVRLDNSYQDFPGYFTLYPKTFFCPLNFDGLNPQFSDDTATIHHFAGSWLPKWSRFKKQFMRKYKKHKVFYAICAAPIRLYRKITGYYNQ